MPGNRDKPSKPSRPLRTRDNNRKVSAPSAEIIEISSDTDEGTPPPPVKRKRTPTAKTRTTTRASSRSTDVNFASAYDHDQASTSSEVEKLKGELESLRKEKRRLEEALAESSRANQNKIPKLDTLEDCITCEICSLKMWSPFILECGHSFCQDCLHGWFTTSFNNFVAAHPDYYNVDVPPQYRDDPRAQAAIDNYRRRNNIPSPSYNCPTCREELKTKPAESFTMKSVVREVARLLGEEGSPKKAQNNARAAGGLWDGFFPPS